MLNLSKGGRLNLSKDESGNKLSVVFFGANWGAIKSSGFFGIGSSTESVDLDASVICLNASNNERERVYFGHRNSSDGAIKHSGDDLTGDEDGDDGMDNEVIAVDLDKVSPSTDKLVFILNSYRHHQFNKIPYMGLRIYTTPNNRPVSRPSDSINVLAKYDLKNESGDPDTTFVDREAIILGYAYRKDGEWKFKACGHTSRSRDIDEIVRRDIPTII